MTEDKKHPLVIEGSGGGKKQKKQRPPVEAPNTLQSAATGRILDLLAYGPIEGVIGGAKGVFLDGTPIQNENGTFNFEGVTVEFRNGTPDQDMIKGFTDVSNVREVNTEIRQDTPVIRSISNMDATSAIVTVRVNALYTRNNDTGDTNGASVPIAIEVEKSGAWTRVVSDNISGKTMSAYERSYRINLPEGGTGVTNIRVSRLNKESDTQDRGDSIAWSKLTEVVDVKQNYPGCALVGIEVDARQFANTLPSRQYLTKLSIIQVPTNYDPISRAYTGIWNGQFKWAWSDNPAWCFYDIASHPVIGANIKNINKFYLYELGKYCDELVDDGYGGKEPRFTFNTILSSPEDAITVFNTLTSVFRGMAYWGSDSVEVVADMPGPIRRQITPSDVIDGEFTYQGTALKERHSVAVVMWNDPENNYDQVPEIVELPEAIELLGYKEVEVTAVACTSRGQARRLGLWILYSEFYETQTVNFTTTVKNADFRPGDYFELLDPYRAGARLGGKVLKLEGTKVTLDAVPSEVSKGWTITLEKEDKGLERYAINSVSGNVLTLAKSPVGILANSNFALSNPDLGARQFRVVSVVETDNHNYGITATEHNPGKYDFVEKGLKLPEKPTSLLPKGGLPQPTGLSAEVFTRVQGGTLHMNATVSWTVEEDPRLDLFVLDVKGPTDFSYRTVYTGSGLSVDMQDIEPGQWSFRVKATSTEWGNSPWFQKTLTLNDLLQPLPPQRLEISTTSFTATIIPVQQQFSISDYEFWRSSVALKHEEIESNALYLGQGLTFIDTGLKFDTEYFYYVRAVNAYGKSDWVAGQAKTQADVEDILEAIFDEANEGEMGKWLQEEIGKIELVVDSVQELEERTDEHSTSIEEIQVVVPEVQREIDHIKEEVDSLNNKLEDVVNAPLYSKDEDYLQGSVVRWEGALWEALADIPKGVLPGESSEWNKIGDFESLSGAINALTLRAQKVESEIKDIDGELTAVNTTISTVRTAFLNREDEGAALEAVQQWYSLAEVTEELDVQSSAQTSAVRRISDLSTEIGETKSSLSELQEVVGTETLATAKEITHLKSELEGKASSEALESLSTHVEQLDDELVSQSKSLTSLQSAIEDVETKIVDDVEVKLQKKADATAVEALETKVTQQGNELTSQSNSLTHLKSEVESLETTTDGLQKETKASAEAISQLTTKAQEQDGVLSSHASLLETISSRVDDNESSIVNESQVRTSADEALAASITKVESKFSAEVKDVLKKVSIQDTRNDDFLPQWYWENHPQSEVKEFKRAATLSLTGFGTYVYLSTIVPWRDASGGKIIQVASDPDNPSKTLQRSSKTQLQWNAWTNVQTSIEAAVKTESTARTAADEALGKRVDTVQANLSNSINSAVRTEAQARATADEALGKRVDTVQATSNSNTTAIQTEARARTSADTALGRRIDTVQASTASANAAIQAEAQARATADEALGKRVDTVQASIGDMIEDLANSPEITSSSVLVWDDPTFERGTNGVAVYDNAWTGRVKVSRVSRAVDNPTSSKYQLNVTFTSGAKPGYGGFWQRINGKANAIFIIKYLIKLQPQYSLNTATNSMGNGFVDKFLGSTKGTGRYETYTRIVKCGPTGTFSTGGHVYVTGGNLTGTNSATLSIAKIECYDVTDGKSLSASVQQISQAQVDLKGQADAMWGVKLQVNSRGEYVTSGISLGLSNTGGTLQSNFIVQANNFIIQDGLNGAGQAAFAVTGGKVVIRSALIGDATITMAKIGGDLYSSDWVAGTRGWRLSQDGQFEINTTVAGEGRIEINNKGMRVFDGQGRVRVKIGDLR